MSKEIYISLCSSTQRRYRFSTPADKLRPTRMGGRRTFLASVFLITIISLLSIYPLPFFNGSSIAGPGTSTLSTSTITVTTGATDTSSVSLIPGGGFKLSDVAHTASYDITTDNFNGYKAQLVASDDNGKLINTADSNYTIPSITSNATSASFPDNKWGILPSKYHNGTSVVTNTDTLLPDPGTTGQVLDITNVANPTTPNTYTIAVGAKVDGSVTSGTYTRTNTITVTPNEIFYTINYNKNTDDTVTNMPGAQSSSTSLTKITLDSATPAREHFEFAGWCNGTTGAEGGAATCSGTVYQPGADFGIDQTTENITTLYAMWNGEEYTQAINIRYQNADGTYSNYQTIDARPVRYGDTYSWSTDEIENFDSTTYVNSGVPEYTVTDSNVHFVDIPRNTKIITLTAGSGVTAVSLTGTGVKEGNKVYYGGTVEISATLKPDYEFVGWTGDTTYANNPQEITNITTNLALTANGLSTTSIQDVTSSQCTTTPIDVYDNRDNQIYTIQRLADGNCWMMQNLNLGATELTRDLTSKNTNLASTITAATFNGWRQQIGLTPTFITVTPENSSDGNDIDVNNGMPYGTLYNYCSASANTICTNRISSDATYDICPAGWRLPKGGAKTDTANEFNNLYTNSAYNSLEKVVAPISDGGLAFAKAGTFYAAASTDLVQQNGMGYWWTSTHKDTSSMYNFTVSSFVNTADGGSGMTRGGSIRCVLDETPRMQNIDASTLDSLVPNSGDKVTLKDNRDGQKYSVAKLPDGNVWMAQNLRFTGTELTPADSNVRSDVAMEYGSLLDAATADSVEEPKINNSGNVNTGVWYNFVAATAGSITGNNNTNTATQDICPAGWRLPSKDEISSISNAASVSAFSPVYGGHYRTGQLYNSNRGNMWSRDAYNTTTRYYLTYYNGALSVQNNTGAIDGFFIRCIYDRSVDMQNISQATIDGMLPTTGSSALFKDTRDGKLYTAAKLADGNIWMTQNLRFTGTELTPADSNVKSDVTMSYIDFGGGENYTDAQLRNTNDITKGVWYNFVAASAGTITGNSNAINATQDICPAGWRLPTSSEQSGLVAAIGSSPSSYSPITSSVIYPNGTEGGIADWWSSTAFSDTNRYTMAYRNNALVTGTTDGRYYGFFIRCVYDKSVTMQNISKADLDAIFPSTGSTATMRDSRDNEIYTVAKFYDGNIWMTQNLRFTGTELTPADSNVENNTTMSYGDLASGNTFDEARIHISNNSNYGVWYNYAAASAGTITGSSNTNEATSSVCPAGWRLPTASEQVNIINSVDTFGPIVGGIYYDNALRNTDYGYWWSSTVYDGALREYLGYHGASTMFTNHTGIGRPNGFYLRCVWNAPVTYMQDFTAADATGLSTGDAKYLTDNRDGQKYMVSKLADGNIWMIDNLNLNASSIAVNQLDSTNTNLEAGKTLSTTTFKDWETSSAVSTYTSGQYIPVSGTDSTSLAKNGTLYNYCAVTAGTICTSSNSSNATSDICPKGWRLPTGNSTGEYQKLYNLTQYNNLTKMRTPIGDGGAAFALPGYFNTGAPIPNTAYWTSTYQAATKSYGMSINTTNGVNPANYGERSLGFSVRCIYGEPTAMQNFSSADASAMAAGETRIVVDSRDSKRYTVTKLADGNVWMTSNLRFTGTTLTPADSDVVSNTVIDYGELAGNADSYDSPMIHEGTDMNGAPVVWYNFAAATATTVTGSSNTDDANYSVCPKGWKIPTRDDIAGITSYTSQFSIIGTGYFVNGVLSYPQYGIWWAATANSATNRYDLNYQNSSFIVGNSGSNRGWGDPIRCVLK